MSFKATLSTQNHNMINFTLCSRLQADNNRVLNAVLRVLFNQLCLTLPLCVVMYPLGVYMGCTSAAPLPSIWTVIRDFLVIMVVEEFIFYYSHRSVASLSMWSDIVFFYKSIHQGQSQNRISVLHDFWLNIAILA